MFERIHHTSVDFMLHAPINQFIVPNMYLYKYAFA